MSGERRLEIGRVVRAHGLRGEVRILLYNPTSDALAVVDTVWLAASTRTGRSYRIAGRRRVGKHVALRLEGVTDRTQAETLVGAQVLVSRSGLPTLEEDEYYHADIVGLDVEDAEGRALGSVVAIYAGGAHDTIDVERADGRRLSVPMVGRYVVRVDVPGGKIVIRHLEDLETGGGAGAV